VVTKILGSEVDKEVSIPRIIRSDIKEMFIREIGIDRGTGIIGGESRDEFNEEERFLALGC
jgi:hypothetical protein